MYNTMNIIEANQNLYDALCVSKLTFKRYSYKYELFEGEVQICTEDHPIRYTANYHMANSDDWNSVIRTDPTELIKYLVDMKECIYHRYCSKPSYVNLRVCRKDLDPNTATVNVQLTQNVKELWSILERRIVVALGIPAMGKIWIRYGDTNEMEELQPHISRMDRNTITRHVGPDNIIIVERPSPLTGLYGPDSKRFDTWLCRFQALLGETPTSGSTYLLSAPSASPIYELSIIIPEDANMSYLKPRIVEAALFKNNQYFNYPEWGYGDIRRFSGEPVTTQSCVSAMKHELERMRHLVQNIKST